MQEKKNDFETCVDNMRQQIEGEDFKTEYAIAVGEKLAIRVLKWKQATT
jgi:hypothetical protein